MKFIKNHIFFIAILALCLTLRLWPLFDYQFTLDELSGLGRTQFSNFGDLIEKGVKTTDTHPALIQIFIFCLSKLFGYANWIIKLPFLLFSFGAIIYSYAFSIRNFSKQTGIFASLIFSFSLIFVYYAPIARMYISGVFFSAALLFYFFEIIFLQNTKPLNFVLFGLFALLSALNQHLNCLFALTVCASGVFFLNRGNARSYLITSALVVLLYLPHLPVTLFQFSVGGIGFDQGGWLPAPDLGSVITFFKVLFGTGKSYLVILLLILLSLLFGKKTGLKKKQSLLLLIFVINGLIIYFYSVYSAPVFQNSVMLFAAVPFVLFISSLIEFRNRFVFYGAATLLAAVLIYKTYIKKEYYSQCVKTVFEYQFERTDFYSRTKGSGKVFAFFFDADTFMKKIYVREYVYPFACEIIPDPSKDSMKNLSQKLRKINCDYLVLASSMPAQQALAREYFPYLIENTQTQAINYKVYSRREEDKNKQVSDDAILKISDALHPGDFNYSKMKPGFSKGGLLHVPVIAANEFPFDAIANYSNVIENEGEELLLTTRFKFRGAFNGEVSSCISVSDEKPNSTYMYNSKEAADFTIHPDSTATVYTDNFFGTPHKQAKQNGRLGCYIWNRGKEDFELTSFEIKVIDYWHQKWHYWE